MMKGMKDQVSGIIDTIVFRSEETGFTVAKLTKKSFEKDAICIVGIFSTIQVGESINCRGIWKHHPTHGKQFDVSDYELSIPKDLKGIKKYLQSGIIRGIGPKNAQRIVDKFGLETIEVLDNDPMQLTNIEGIGKKRAKVIMEHWQEQKSMRDVMIFLRGHDIGSALSKKIYRHYGDNSIKVIQENPYALAREMFGVGFKTADQIAFQLEMPKNSKVRIEAGIEYVLNSVADEGHVCYPEEKLILLAEKMLEVDRSSIISAINALEGDKRIIRKELMTSEDPILHVWLAPHFFSEIGIAKELARLSKAPCSIRPIKCDKALEWVQEKHKLKLAKEQTIALQTSLSEKLHIITGGPGTGKSTITKAILSIHEKISENILLCAPTGRAAKRMSEITRRRASTIHSLLEFDFTNGGFKRNKDNPLKCDLIIIDEFSMVDNQLMYSLIKAIPDESRVIFIGDIDQLPSVGAGNVLKDLIESKRIPLTRLYQIFRQGKGSRITLNAHNINRGIFPDIEPMEQSDFYFFEVAEQEDIAEQIISLVSEKIPSSFSFDPFDEIQVLSPMRRGIIGIENLNNILQKKLNPEKTSVEWFGQSFRLGDKVMQIRNNYTKGVFNGDVGRIVEIDTETSEIVITFDGKEIPYEQSELNEIVLAYAVSIHKYQGSECPCIIIPLHSSHFKLLQRNLLYTGITRGKKLVILVGTKRAIAQAIANDEVKTRHTGLSYFIADRIALPERGGVLC